ncbi:MAG: hypothetical protein RL560_19 [Actinomycetota bacterium]|jgi:hypothetical protein
MSFYTQQCINSYRAGWMEEHPDEEPLDDATVISCLRDEHEMLVERLIKDDLRHGHYYLAIILREGFEGYENMDVSRLWQEVEERGLF